MCGVAVQIERYTDNRDVSHSQCYQNELHPRQVKKTIKPHKKSPKSLALVQASGPIRQL
jgi:hypothetical protein